MAASRAPRPARLPRKPPDQYHHGDLRRALLQAAVRTIQKQGIHALTLRAVGDDLGVSRTALYRHFADKAALLATVAAEGFRRLRLELEGAWEHGGKDQAAFQAMGAAYVRFAREHPSHYRVMFGSGFDRGAPHPELDQEGPAAFQILVGALVEQQRKGLVRAEDPLTQARVVWSLVHGIAMLTLDGAFEAEGVDVAALTRYAVERLGTGIGEP